MTVLSVAFFCGCNNGNNGGNGNQDMGDGGGGGGGNFSVVSTNVTIAPGADCEAGGVRVDIGLDNGDGGGVPRDGVLQTGEIDTSKLVCNPVNATFATVTAATPLALGNADCPFGGTRIDYGLDNGEGGGTPNDGLLQAGEIDGHTNACVPMPQNLLTRRTPIAVGDVDCPRGGELLESGFDDGAPAGTAGNSVLEDEEVDYTQRRCNPSAEETFPPTTGTAGPAILDVRGGNGPDSGSYGGYGGSVLLRTNGGPLAAAVEVYKAGTLTVDTTTAKPAFVPGDHPIVISADTEIPQVAAATTGLHIRGFSSTVPTPYTWTLYDGDTVVTSLDIAAGATLTLVGDGVAVRFGTGDIRNAGTIRAVSRVESFDSTTSLDIECHHFLNEGSGVVDQRAQGGGELAGRLGIWALVNGDGQIYNAGTLRTDGWDEAATGSPGATMPADLTLTAGGTIWNGGVIDASGAESGSDNALPTSGRTITVQTLKGNVVNEGTIEASGGRGEAGAGGTILLLNGAWNEGPPLLADNAAYGPGSFAGKGTLRARGGDKQNQDPGSGGSINIRMLGGSLTSSQTIDVRGGSFTESGGESFAGNGGSIYLGTFTWVGLDGKSAPIAAGPVTLGVAPGATGDDGSLLASGGTGAGLIQGGSGGDITVLADVAITSGGGFGLLGGGGLAIEQPFDLSKLSPTAQARVRLIGFGRGIDAHAGDGDGGAGNGGSISFRNVACESEGSLNQCAFVHIGPRLIATDVDLDVAGGNSNGNAGVGGQVSARLTAEYNQVTASLDAAQILFRGPVDASAGSGGSNVNSGGDFAQYFDLTCDSCDVELTGDLDLSGAELLNEGTSGGYGGGLSVAAFRARFVGAINADGGPGVDGDGGGGSVSFSGYELTSSSAMTARGNGGGRVELQAALACRNTGAIDLDSRRPASGDGPPAGSFDARCASFENSAPITARGAAVRYIGIDGGSILVQSTSMTNSGDLDVSGGDALADEAAFAGRGGSIVLVGVSGQQSGALVANGGSAIVESSVDAIGGAGGTVYVQVANSGVIEASGGEAASNTNATGGAGGTLTLGGANTAAATLRGGNANGDSETGGNGGNASILSTNTACVDVSAGSGITQGAPGTLYPVDAPNVCE